MARINKYTDRKGETVWRIRFQAYGKVYKPRIAVGKKLDARVKAKYLSVFTDFESHVQANEPLSPKLVREINSFDEGFKARLQKLDGLNLEIWETPTLEKFLTEFIELKAQLTEHTVAKMRISSKYFCICFGSDTKLSVITSAMLKIISSGESSYLKRNIAGRLQKQH